MVGFRGRLGDLWNTDEEISIDMVHEPNAGADAVTPEVEGRGLLGERIVEHGVAGIDKDEEAPLVTLGKPTEERWSAELQRARDGIVARDDGFEVTAHGGLPAEAVLLGVHERIRRCLALHLAEELEIPRQLLRVGQIAAQVEKVRIRIVAAVVEINRFLRACSTERKGHAGTEFRFVVFADRAGVVID